jgi:hypothetical protein
MLSCLESSISHTTRTTCTVHDIYALAVCLCMLMLDTQAQLHDTVRASIKQRQAASSTTASTRTSISSTSTNTTTPNIDLSAMNAAFAQQIATYFMATATATATTTAADNNTCSNRAGYSMIDGSTIVSNVCPFRHAKLVDIHISVSERCEYDDMHSNDSIHNWKKSIQQLKIQCKHKQQQQQQQQQQHNVCIRAHGILLDAATVTTSANIHSR